jgi:hypothetical protein
MIRDLRGFKDLLEMFTVRNRIQNSFFGCLVGHPYIASLWLGSLALKRSHLKGVLRRS